MSYKNESYSERRKRYSDLKKNYWRIKARRLKSLLSKNLQWLDQVFMIMMKENTQSLLDLTLKIEISWKSWEKKLNNLKKITNTYLKACQNKDKIRKKIERFIKMRYKLQKRKLINLKSKSNRRIVIMIILTPL